MVKTTYPGSAKLDDLSYLGGSMHQSAPPTPQSIDDTATNVDGTRTSSSGTGRLPSAPTRDRFATQEEFEEALGYWQSHVGRIKGLVERAKRFAASTETPPASS